MMRSIVWGSRIAVDEVFFRLWNKVKFQLKRWYTSSVPSGQLPLLRGEASCVGAVHALLTCSKNAGVKAWEGLEKRFLIKSAALSSGGFMYTVDRDGRPYKHALHELFPENIYVSYIAPRAFLW